MNTFFAKEVSLAGQTDREKYGTEYFKKLFTYRVDKNVYIYNMTTQLQDMVLPRQSTPHPPGRICPRGE